MAQLTKPNEGIFTKRTRRDMAGNYKKVIIVIVVILIALVSFSCSKDNAEPCACVVTKGSSSKYYYPSQYDIIATCKLQGGTLITEC